MVAGVCACGGPTGLKRLSPAQPAHLSKCDTQGVPRGVQRPLGQAIKRHPALGGA